MSRPTSNVAAPSSNSTSTQSAAAQAAPKTISAAQSVAATRDTADEVLGHLREFENRSKAFFDRISNALNQSYSHEEARSDMENLLAYLSSVENIIQKNSLQHLSYVRVEPGEAPGAQTDEQALSTIQLADKCRGSIGSMERAMKTMLSSAQTTRSVFKSAQLVPNQSPASGGTATSSSV